MGEGMGEGGRWTQGWVLTCCCVTLPPLLPLTLPAATAPCSGPVTSVEWCPYESSMLCTTSSDNQLAVWDLALERDPGECGRVGGWAGGREAGMVWCMMG